MTHASTRTRWVRKFAELPLVLGAVTCAAVLAGFDPVGGPTAPNNLLWSGWLVACVILCAIRAMTHADHLAERFGEPVGTIILTLAAITIEVAAVCAMMLGSGGSPTVARDSMFSVIMVILNALVGGCMILGSFRRGEQAFNPDSSSAYLPLLITLGTLTLVLPRFTHSSLGGWMSDSMEVFIGGGSLVVYVAFLWMQTSRYRGFFAVGTPVVVEHAAPLPPLGRSIALLLVSLVLVVISSKGLAGHLPPLLDALHLPQPFAGVVIAAMVLAPEGFAALRASARGDMQRSINVLLGSAIATIGLTVPAVLAVRAITGSDPELGLEPPYIVLLALTFIASSLNLARGRVNAIQGLVHLLIFISWIATIIDESLPPELP